MAWHLRPINSEQVQWFRNLIDLHALTLAWLKAEDKPELSKLFPVECLGLESISPKSLDRALEARLLDTYPEELLARTESLVWRAQAQVLSELIESEPAKSRTLLRARLEQAAWHAGAVCAEQRWPTLRTLLPNAPAIAREAKRDLRIVHQALSDSPFSRGTVTLRATASDLRIESGHCAHHIDDPAVRAVSGDLCQLQAHWVRGFAAGLNPEIGIEYVPLSPGEPGSRCRQRWFFVPASPRPPEGRPRS